MTTTSPCSRDGSWSAYIYPRLVRSQVYGSGSRRRRLEGLVKEVWQESSGGEEEEGERRLLRRLPCLVHSSCTTRTATFSL